MTRNIIALIGLVLLAGCSGGGGDPATTSSAPPPATPTAQPDMLTATNQGLLRGKANGQGQQLIFSQPNLQQQFNLLVRGGNVVYTRTKPNDDQDIWTVRTDGTGDRALVNTQHDENLRAVSGPWMLYSKHIDTAQEVWSHNLNTGAQHLLDDEEWSIDVYPYGTDRVMFKIDHQLFSKTVTGSDRILYTDIMDGGASVLGTTRITPNALIYGHDDISGDGVGPLSQLFAVPLAGGNPVPLESDQFSSYFDASVGNRIVYHRRPVPSGNADVVSIDADGTDRVVLASHPANEAVQGVTTDQVIIRRNLSGNDHLIAVPVAGGTERLLLTMTDSEFVDLIVGDLLIVRRPSGTWSLDLNGRLTKLGTVVGDSGFVAVGDAVCVTKVTAVWCMPLDGSGPQVKIADEGNVVGVL